MTAALIKERYYILTPLSFLLGGLVLIATLLLAAASYLSSIDKTVAGYGHMLAALDATLLQDMAQDNRRQLGVLEASLDKQAIAAGASAINPIWAIAHQFKYEGGGAPEELVGRREPMHQQIPDADAGQVAAGQQDGFEQGLTGEEGGEKKAQYAAGPARRCGQAWIAHHAAEHDRIGRPEGRQQVGGAGEDADQREQQYQGGDTQQSGQGRQCA